LAVRNAETSHIILLYLSSAGFFYSNAKIKGSFSTKLFVLEALKEQCHEIVSEISPWSSRLGLN
jgi:hypothetical protein